MDEASPAARARPLSPHIWIWRWHVTMAASILHRLTGAALYAGVFLLALWAGALAYGPVPYAQFMGLLASLPGRIVLFGLTVALFFHLANGLRHLAWDFGLGFKPRTADATAWTAIVLSLAAAVAVWIIAPATGAP
jgi:succinate dehydrogenase / fumarate reductase cytochrome b subunit